MAYRIYFTAIFLLLANHFCFSRQAKGNCLSAKKYIYIGKNSNPKNSKGIISLCHGDYFFEFSVNAKHIATLIPLDKDFEEKERTMYCRSDNSEIADYVIIVTYSTPKEVQILNTIKGFNYTFFTNDTIQNNR